MDTFDAIEQRRSIKHFDRDHEMSTEEVNKLFSLAMLTPTSFNIQNWRFVYITDKAKRQAIQDAAWGQAQVTEASMLILVCADLNAWDRDPTRYWQDAPKAVADQLIPMITQFYKDNEALQHDEALRSVGMASQTLMLTAKAMGYDSCPMIGFDAQKVGDIIALPDDHIVGMMLTIGKPIKAANARAGQIPMSEVVFENQF
jgi:nitroreductase